MLPITYDAIVGVTNHHSISSNWKREAAGKYSNPGKTEEADGKFVVIEERTDAKDD